MSNETITIPVAFLNELATAYTDGAVVLNDTIAVFDQMAQLFGQEKIKEEDAAEVNRLNQDVVTPLLRSVEMRFNLLQQKIVRVRDGQAATPPPMTDLAEALANGVETIISVQEVFNGLVDGLNNQELVGADASALADACHETHLPALEQTIARFGDSRQAIAQANGSAGANGALWSELTTTFAGGYETVNSIRLFLQQVADQIAAGELQGDEAADLERLLRNPLLPVMEAVAEKLQMLQTETESAVVALDS